MKIERLSIASLNDKILTYQKDVDVLEPDIKNQKQIFDKKNKEFSKIEETYSLAQEQIKSLEKSRWDSQERIVDERSNLDRAISSIHEKTIVIKHINDKKTTLEKDQEDFSLDQKKNDSQAEKCNLKVEDIKQEIVENQKKLEKSEGNYDRLKMEIHVEETELQSLKSQLIFFNELIEQKQGYPEGAKTNTFKSI